MMMNECTYILKHSLITGGNGMVGKHINFGYKPSSREMDVTNCESIKMYISTIKNKISCIIHLVALNLRESEENNTNSIYVNINGTINMLNVAMSYDIPFILMSTGAVFSSLNKNMTFDEQFKTCPNCVYGHTKLSSERVAALYKQSIIIRTGWLFGGNKSVHNNFVETCINKFIVNDKIMASDDFYGSPTYIVDLIEKMQYLILHSLYGIHHVVNDGKATGYDIANELATLLNKDKNLITNVKKENVPNAGPNRSNSEVLETMHPFNKMRSWQIALNEYLNVFISNNKIKVNDTWSDRTNCRLCNSINLYIFLKLASTPPANHFVSEPKKQDVIPLHISMCKDCKHIQLIQIVNPSYQYSNYIYVSNASKIMENHLINSVNKFIERTNISKTSNILEIGANDGTCIKHLLDNGFTNVVGIDPASNIHERHNLPIICDFFNSKIKNILKQKYESFKLIYAFHCCAHIENIQDVFLTIYDILDSDGIFIMEVGYFYEVFKNKLFDTIYHEHIDYHTCTALQQFALNHNLLLYDVHENDIQGGSIQFFFTKNMSHLISDNVDNSIKKENELDLFNTTNLIAWQNEINLCKQDLHYLFSSLKFWGKKIAGYGASAKSTTFLYQYNLNAEILDFIIDDSVYKHNMYTPGLHIPIKPLTILDTEQIDYIIILSWNFTNVIVNNLKKYRSNGMRIIVPFPEIKII